MKIKCSYAYTWHHETPRPANCFAIYVDENGEDPTRCGGHLSSGCESPAVVRLRHADGWGQQYACAEHIGHFESQDYKAD